MRRTAHASETIKLSLGAAAVVTIAVALRFSGLDRLGLWWDEGWSIYFAGLPVGEMLQATSVDIHPPLYYLLLRGWSLAFGYSPVAARALSALAGLAVVLIGWALGRQLLGRKSAALAALLLALAPMHVFHSQEARMYALAAALSLASWVVLLRRERAVGRQRLCSLAYGLVTAAAFYTEYYAVLLWVGQAAYLLGRDYRPGLRARLRERSWLFLPVLLYLPWLTWAGPRLIAYVAQKQDIETYRAVDPITYLWQHLSAFAAGHTWADRSWLLPGLTTVVFLALAYLGWRAMGRGSRARWALACLGGLPLAVAYLIHLAFPFTPSFYERILLPFSAPLYLAVGHGVVHASRRALAQIAFAGAAVLLPVLSLIPVLTATRYQATDYRPLFRVMRESGYATDTILCVHPWQYGYALSYLPPGGPRPALAPTDRWADSDARAADLAHLTASSRVIWFPRHESLGRILESEISATLAGEADEAYAAWYGGDTLLVAYSAPEARLAEGGRGVFDGGPALLASAYSVQAASGTGLVTVWLQWDDSPLGGDVSLRLVDSGEQVWASSDFPRVGGEQRRALLVPWGTPAVPLYLTVSVSRNGTPIPLPAEPANRHALEIGIVDIRPAGAAPPRLEDLVARRVQARFENGLLLVGSSAWKKPYSQGDALPLDLLWRSERTPAVEPVLFIQALDVSGAVVAATERRITGGTWSPVQWPPGALVRDFHSLLLPADAPPGPLRLIAGLLDPDSRQTVGGPAGGFVELGSVDVRQAQRTYDRPDAPVMEPVRFADLLALDGSEVTPCPDLQTECLLPSTRLQVRLIWQAQATTSTRYRSFVHLVCDGRIVSQSDQDPAGTASTAWLPGQYLDDVHYLDMHGDVSCPTGLSLQVGVYDPLTEQRLEPLSHRASQGALTLETQPSR